MYDYVDFVCKWSEYYIDNRTDSQGNIVKGFYFNASDAKRYITEGALKYGNDPEYFNNLIKSIEQIDKEAFSALIENIREAEALAQKAVNKLNNGEYSQGELQYIEKFDITDYIYTIKGGDELKAELNQIYEGFELWLGSWEL